MSVPQKYKRIGDFHEYYSGAKVAPYLTVFVGGNHEASSHLFELYYGGWVAPNIYYMGAANIIRCGPLRIAGVSGIWKGYDYNKPHFERLPYNRDDMQSIYHVREIDVRKLLQLRSQVDVGVSHDWPQGIEWAGDYHDLFRRKPHFEKDARSGKLGSVAAKCILDRLRPPLWFSAHLHCKFVAFMEHGDYIPPTIRGRPKRDERQTQTSQNIAGSSQSLAETEEQTERAPHPVRPEPGTMNESTFETFQRKSDETRGDSRTKTTGDTRQPGTVNSQLSAWQNFHSVATEEEAEEHVRYLKDAAAYRQKIADGVLEAPKINYEQTWRKVGVKDTGLEREVTDVVKTGAEFGNKDSIEGINRDGDSPTLVKNTDEIDLDDDTTGSSDNARPMEPVPLGSAKVHKDVSNTVKNADEIDLDDEDNDNGPANALDEASPKKAVTEDKLSVSMHHPEEPRAVDTESSDALKDIREQLPESFKKPASEGVTAEAPAFDTVLPEKITNRKTKFMALDKCGRQRQFIQLLEIPTVSSYDGPAERPFRLQYDKEWLAITRVFADELILGDPDSSIAKHKGDAHYKPLIASSGEWVEENIVKQGKMIIPENFVRTAPVYDPSVPVSTTQFPSEYTNPQTSQFCELVGIENKFDMSEEERRAREDQGPRPDQPRFHRGANHSRRPFGGRGSNRGGRGGSGGRGGRGVRGGRGSRGRGRGRGRSYGDLGDNWTSNYPQGVDYGYGYSHTYAGYGLGWDQGIFYPAP